MDQFSAHIDRGWDLIHRGDVSGALLSAEKSLELDAQSPEAHNLLGYVCAVQGAAEDALEHYRQALALDDTFVEAMLNAAEVLIHPIHDFDGAMGMVEDALDFAEGDDEVADALLLRFDAYLHSGDRDGAERTASELPVGPFESPRLDFLLGRAHCEVGRNEQARELLQRAITREPDNADAHYYLGLALEALSDHAGAISALLRTRELDVALAPVAWSLPSDQFEVRVRAAVARLTEPFADKLGDPLIIVSDLPGAEVVADGVDPRAGLMLDTAQRAPDKPGGDRLFVYRRSLERMCQGLLDLEPQLVQLLEAELMALHPTLESAPRSEIEEP